MSKKVINKKVRASMAEDPFYSTCALTGYFDHTCEGRITWEHAIIYASCKVQEPWSIIPLCEKGHAVDHFQDAGTMNKEYNVWVALNRASVEELRAVSKAVNYLRWRNILNEKYGVWVQIDDVRINYGI